MGVRSLVKTVCSQQGQVIAPKALEGAAASLWAILVLLKTSVKRSRRRSIAMLAGKPMSAATRLFTARGQARTRLAPREIRT
jgi:hypothetical protein